MHVDNSVNAHLVHIGARVEAELAEAVAQLAREGDRSLSRQVRRAIVEHVAARQDSVVVDVSPERAAGGAASSAAQAEDA